MTALTVVPSTAKDDFHLTRTSLVMPEGLSYAHWCQFGGRLAMIHEGLMWALGDWLCWGKAHYGEDRYTQAIEASGHGLAVLEMAEYAALHVPTENREPSLSFRHHVIVAPLDPPQQRSWLAKAKAGAWTTRQLALALHHTLHPNILTRVGFSLLCQSNQASTIKAQCQAWLKAKVVDSYTQQERP